MDFPGSTRLFALALMLVSSARQVPAQQLDGPRNELCEVLEPQRTGAMSREGQGIDAVRETWPA